MGEESSSSSNEAPTTSSSALDTVKRTAADAVDLADKGLSEASKAVRSGLAWAVGAANEGLASGNGLLESGKVCGVDCSMGWAVLMRLRHVQRLRAQQRHNRRCATLDVCAPLLSQPALAPLAHTDKDVISGGGLQRAARQGLWRVEG